MNPVPPMYHRAMEQNADTPTISADDEIVLDDELLVEEISIDGMCGVY
mgnify:CR=1 FL=1